MNVVEAKRILKKTLYQESGWKMVSIAKRGRAAITLGIQGLRFTAPAKAKEGAHQIIRFLISEVEKRVTANQQYTDQLLGILAILQPTDSNTKTTVEKILAKILHDQGRDENFKITTIVSDQSQLKLLRNSINLNNVRDEIQSFLIEARRKKGTAQRNEEQKREKQAVQRSEAQKRAKEAGDAYRKKVREKKERDQVLSTLRNLEGEVRIVGQPQTTKTVIGGLSLDGDDLALICRWANLGSLQSLFEISSQIGRLEASRLASARLAEKAAIEFYRSNGARVEDVSVLQLSDSDLRWKQFDLLVDGRPIDVKNCRQSESVEIGYSEVFVPEFKRSRSLNQDVTIAGVLSEYRSVDWLKNNRSTVQILGESSYSDLQTALRSFSDAFDVNIEFSLSTCDSRLPYWCFDYVQETGNLDEAVDYVDRISRVLMKHETLRTDYRLPQSVQFRLRCLGAKSGGDLERDWLVPKELVSRMLSYFGDLPMGSAITRTHLFMLVLGLTLERIKDHDAPWRPSNIANLLFIDEADTDRPLGLCDPLEYIWRFIEAVDCLCIESEQQRIRFKSYRMANPWILLGIDASGQTWTLVAYCGGRKEIERNNTTFETSCGYSPLILGKHKTCKACRKLICPECDHCTRDCSRAGRAKQTESCGEFDYPEYYFR